MVHTLLAQFYGVLRELWASLSLVLCVQRVQKYAQVPLYLACPVTFGSGHQSVIKSYHWKADEEENMVHTLFVELHWVLTEIQGSLSLVQCVYICTEPWNPLGPSNFCSRDPINHHKLPLKSWWRVEHGTYFICPNSSSIDRDIGLLVLLVPGAIYL